MPGSEHPPGERHQGDQDESQRTARAALAAGPPALLRCCHLLVLPLGPTAPGSGGGGPWPGVGTPRGARRGRGRASGRATVPGATT
ncbi:putative protein-export membrane protein SecD [Streptomyces albus]|uniref:Uncharacterized protein n=1 Tax=Streptomyces albus (strain ATCC 21838 / DSM 41398 / FERM P-419 / JCM 4703 / NBRC 107858) TaxID=1081613 RepID=A0A0B5F7H0_STRA4|nr:putative protein-export membrane protein SecD [Streptomyces albus]AOU81100.1 putative protein-export membrane protein SecD [Streptomyces albus]